jgi:hypothetical protein
MANQETVKALQTKVTALLAFDRQKLIKREEWGSITFDKADHDYKRIFDIADYLKLLPVDVLSDSTVSQISSSIEQCRALFDQIHKFTIESGNPAGSRDSFVAQVQAHADQLFSTASPWIPFLAYQKGDVQKNISTLNSSVGKAATLIGEAKLEVEKKAKEIDEIIVKAREASSAAGAAVFTKDFNLQAHELERKAQRWIVMTTILAVATLASAVFFYFYIKPATSELEVFQRIASKLAIIGILISSTIWCGRIYKSLMHQSCIYRFKALGLQTFQAFSAGSADTQTKNAVLMETTRAIFSNHQTGYIEESGNSDTQIVEILKSTLPSSEK